MRILFVLKLNTYGYGISSSGLFNSSNFLVEMLNQNGQTAKLVQVVDNNSIDKEVNEFKPDIVVIEALWVVPAKFAVLARLHPKVKWVVRGHSDLPFLAHEGVGMQWFLAYPGFKNVSIAFNCKRTFQDFKALLPSQSGVFYLPNYYPTHFLRPVPDDNVFRVGCFGAIRPLKNQLTQAVAAVRFAKQSGQDLEFHVNATRLEGGDEILKNLRGLFAKTPYRLVEHPWVNHAAFLALMRQMSVELAVSMSETFCITAADAVASGVPLICSDQVPFATPYSVVRATDVDAMIDKLNRLGGLNAFEANIANRDNLRHYSLESRKIWLEFLE
jgi:glycosyltransferase involved in cell wall biosynthesis